MDKDLSFVQLKRTDTNIQFTVFAFLSASFKTS